MSHQLDKTLKATDFSIQLNLNSQQRELLERAAAAEGLPTIAALVRLAIAETDSASMTEKSGD